MSLQINLITSEYNYTKMSFHIYPDHLVKWNLQFDFKSKFLKLVLQITKSWTSNYHESPENSSGSRISSVTVWEVLALCVLLIFFDRVWYQKSKNYVFLGDSRKSLPWIAITTAKRRQNLLPSSQRPELSEGKAVRDLLFGPNFQGTQRGRQREFEGKFLMIFSPRKRYSWLEFLLTHEEMFQSSKWQLGGHLWQQTSN